MDALRLALVVGLLAIGLTVAAPGATACGFEEYHEVAPGVAWGMHCTRPFVEVFGQEIDPLGTVGNQLP